MEKAAGRRESSEERGLSSSTPPGRGKRRGRDNPAGRRRKQPQGGEIGTPGGRRDYSIGKKKVECSASICQGKEGRSSVNSGEGEESFHFFTDVKRERSGRFKLIRKFA